MKIVGLTGGIGSGKSVVSELLRIMGVPVYDSDLRSKKLCDTDEDLKKGIIDLFGPELYSNGLLNRSMLAERIFVDEIALKAVNQLIHPAVVRDFQVWSGKYNQCPFVVMESAILFEAGLEKLFEHVLCVTAPENLRIKRVCKRNGATSESVKERMNNQISEAERVERSDIFIINDDTQAVIPQIIRIVQSLS